MPGLSFLSKKSWHTSNISNQEKVWIAEQKAAAEEAKLKELTQQIKLEREQEELQKITGKKSSSTGDRGVDWMYEGHKKGEDDEERKKLEGDAQNEAYLLGKEYVPEGQTKHSGDFAVAASMTGALEKASTVGATIGVEAGGMYGGEGEEAGLRIQDESNTATAAAGSTMNEWNQNFHLRHEDPMFSVMQRKQAKDKDVEKKIKLMERAGMVVKEITKPTAAEKMQHDEQEDKNRERRRRKDSKKSSSKKKRKHKHNKSHRRHHKKRSRRERSSSPSSDDGYSTYSSSSSYSSEDSQRGRHRNDRREGSKKRSSRRHYDDYERHHSSDRRRDRKRSESREGRRRDRSPERRDYDRYERHYKHESSERRRERSRSYSMDREGSRGERRSRGNDYRDYDGGDSRSSRRENDRDKYDDKKLPAEAAAAVAAPDGNTLPKKEGYGLIGTSLSNKGNNNNKSSSKPTSNGNGDYLGPDQKLREAKREEMERERQSRLGQGRKRRHGETSEERQIALEEMERNARDREKRWSK